MQDRFIAVVRDETIVKAPLAHACITNASP